MIPLEMSIVSPIASIFLNIVSSYASILSTINHLTSPVMSLYFNYLPTVVNVSHYVLSNVCRHHAEMHVFQVCQYC
ncbi:hypothetical protein M8J77_006288 [Diaphorina citri]|nr:hypothetical protein M8J77_006288 [Diaphorina citri]